MSTLFETVSEYFKNAEWPVEADDDALALGGQVEGDTGTWLVLGDVIEEENTFVFYSLFEEMCPEDRRTAVAELFIRLNPSLLVASYELDYETGEMRLKSAIDVSDSTLPEQLWRNLVEMNTALMSEFFPAVSKVAFEGGSPEAVMQELAEADAKSDEFDA